MKTVGELGMVDGLDEVPLTTRTWSTMTAVAGVLGAGAKRRSIIASGA